MPSLTLSPHPWHTVPQALITADNTRAAGEKSRGAAHLVYYYVVND